MSGWIERTVEEQSLFNPVFCSAILFYTTSGYQKTAKSKMPWTYAFIILPMVLHRETRGALPKNTRTYLSVWLERNPVLRASLQDRAPFFVPLVKETLRFSARHGLLTFDSGSLGIRDSLPRINALAVSGEVKECLDRGSFIGRWFGKSGDPVTVFALWGVRH